jgi:hypothetical protein
MKRAAIAATLACACGPDSTATNDTTSGDASSDGSDTTPDPTAPDPTTSSSGAPDPDTSTTTSSESTTTTSTDEGSDDVYEEDTGGTGCAFTCPSQPSGGGGGFVECDIWAQDCMAGEKCMPWANDGGPEWNSTRCSPLDDTPALLGEPCMVEGSGVSGIDDCDIGYMCWDVDLQNQGTCAALCMGSEASPTCPGEDVCLVVTEVLSLCETGCDPLAPDCPDGEACGTTIGAHVCTPAGPAGPGDACVDVACAAGLVCVDGAAIASCDALACCTPYCDPAGAPCPGGATCQPLDIAPDVGVCIDLDQGAGIQIRTLRSSIRPSPVRFHADVVSVTPRSRASAPSASSSTEKSSATAVIVM